MKNLKINQTILIMLVIYFFLFPLKNFTNATISSPDILKVGKPLPNANLKAYGKTDVNLNQLKG